MIEQQKQEGSVSGSGRAHSLIGASGFSRWSKCPGSIGLQRVAESQEVAAVQGSKFAAEGTAAHEVAALCLEQGSDTWEWVGQTVHLKREQKNWPVTAEMAEAVQLWVDTVRQDREEYAATTGDTAVTLVEVSFDLSDIRDGAFGTSDAVTLFPHWGMMSVYDYKHGVGIGVDAERNGQLMYYAAGALHHLGANAQDIQAAELVIVQPRHHHRYGPVRRWRTTTSELNDWVWTELVPAIDRTREPDAPLVPGDHCQFCPARAFCPALQELAQEYFDMSDRPVQPMSDEELSEWLGKVKAVRHFLKALDDEGYHRLSQGNKVPGYKLVARRADRVWADGAEAELKAALGGDAYKQTLISPAQASKRRETKEIAKKFSYKPENGLTMAPASDSNEGVEVKPPQAGFQQFAR